MPEHVEHASLGNCRPRLTLMSGCYTTQTVRGRKAMYPCECPSLSGVMKGGVPLPNDLRRPHAPQIFLNAASADLHPHVHCSLRVQSYTLS